MVKAEKIKYWEIVSILFLSILFGVGMGNIFVGNLNLLDEGQFISWPFQMLHGKFLFKDLFVMYGPLFVYPLYTLFKIFGPSFFIERVYFLLGAILGVLSIYYLSLILNLKKVVRLLIILLVIALPGIQIRQAAALIVVIILLAANQSKNGSKYFILGICSTIAFLISPEIGIFSFIAVLVDFLIGLREKNFFERVIIFSVGLVSSFLLFSVWAYSEKWFFKYITETYKILTLFSGVHAPLGKNLPNMFSLYPGFNAGIAKYLLSLDAIIYWVFLFLIINGVYFISRFVMGIFSDEDRKVLPIYIICLLLFLSVVGRGNVYFILPFLLILGGYIGQKALKLKNRTISIIFIFLLLIIPFRLLTINRINLVTNVKDIINYNRYVQISKNDILRIPTSEKKYIDEIRKDVEALSGMNDSIFILQDEPGLYMVAGRVNSTRFDLPYFAGSSNDQESIIKNLKNKRTKIIVWNKNAWAVDDIPNNRRLPKIVDYVKKHYNVKQNNDGIVIYELNE